MWIAYQQGTVPVPKAKIVPDARQEQSPARRAGHSVGDRIDSPPIFTPRFNQFEQLSVGVDQELPQPNDHHGAEALEKVHATR